LRGLYSKEYLIDELKKEAIRLGRVPKQEEYKHGERCRVRFGSWKKTLELAGLDTSYLSKKYTDEDLLQQIIDKYNEIGRIPTTSQVKNYVNIIRRFGTWHNALYKAGFRKEDLKLYKEKYTDDELLNMIKEKSKKLGRIPNINDMLYKSKIYERFGTWENALTEAGFNKKDIYYRNKKYTNEDLLNILKEKYYKQGKIPKTYDIKQYNVIVKRFGSFNEALKKAELI